jgi:hypothetical protein
MKAIQLGPSTGDAPRGWSAFASSKGKCSIAEMIPPRGNVGVVGEDVMEELLHVRGLCFCIVHSRNNTEERSHFEGCN